MKHGLLLIDKPAGCTSHDVVQKVRRVTRQKRIGHCGTLDPDATGLLLLTLGNATRLTRFLIRAPKVYEGVIAFGAATDTYDGSGTVVEERSTAGLTTAAIGERMAAMIGTIEQAPPPFSAKKVKGVKYYELARRGEEVPTEPKEVTIFELIPLGSLDGSRLAFRLACSSGTYARTLAHDLGQAVETGAHLAELRRLRIGGFTVDDAITLAALEGALAAVRQEQPEVPEEALAAAAGRAWVPFDLIPLPFAEAMTDAQQEHRLSHGQTVLLRDLSGEEGDWVKLLSQRRRFIAVGTVVERIGSGGVGLVQPKVVFK
jgi:tRNA pseudouridine55 synthase